MTRFFPRSIPARSAASSARNVQSLGQSYQIDRSRPVWHGWHAFRRGLATNLHDLGVDDKTIQAILRHSNVAVTQACYIKTLPKQSIAAMQKLEMLVDRSGNLQ